MAQCVALSNGYVVSSSTDCDYVLLTQEEVQQLTTSPVGSLTIDSEVYTTVTGFLLLSFLSGHILGRIVKALGRR